MHELLFFVAWVSGISIGSGAAEYFIRRSRLKWENEQLHKWIEAQARTQELGPYRLSAAPIPMPRKEMMARTAARALREGRPVVDHYVTVGKLTYVDENVARPEPTSIPSGGRAREE